MNQTLTPAMQQYVDIKKAHADCILFFRIGDFYETFWEDAKTCSKVLDLVLTSKNKDSEHPIPLAGIPYHSVDKYIPRLIAHGYKVAIAEQTTDPAPGKIVEREVVQIITPGTYLQEQQKDFKYILSVTNSLQKNGSNYHIARGDFSLGQYWTKSFIDIPEMHKFILTIRPVEIIFDVDFREKDLVWIPIQQQLNCLHSSFEIPSHPEDFLKSVCTIQSLASFGQAVAEGKLHVLTLLLNYLKDTQKSNLPNIVRISLHNEQHRVLFDDITIKNLELFASSYEGSERQSLFGILNTTKTSGGSRLFRQLLMNPINDIDQLTWRGDQITRYLSDTNTSHLHHLLGNLSDIPRLVTAILYKKLSPNVYVKLRATLRLCFEHEVILQELQQLGLQDTTLTTVKNLYDFLNKLLKSDEEVREEIEYIADGYDAHIDELRKIAYHSDDLLLQYQQELVQKTGVNNVKVKFVMNQGYFLEITNKDIEIFENKALELGLIRRNTLKGGQRYTSEYLDSIQGKILEARDDLIKQERALLEGAKFQIATLTSELDTFAEKLAWLDVLTSHALFVKEHKCTRPLFGQEFSILQGRHPVIEAFLPRDQQFIPNDLNFHSANTNPPLTPPLSRMGNESVIHIITGPNMGGKSTYLRQNALIVLLAHCGFFVPAQSCHLPLVDGIFARVGSGDVIAKNQSTFMTEMIEVANILNNATEKSFIIFDELGRGTSTYDGLALTKAILEYLVSDIQAKTLIATHYHELIALEDQLPGVKNFSVSVYETEKEVVFMKKIVPGGASKSYGIDVAKIAGINPSILNLAKQHLNHLEQEKMTHSSTPLLATPVVKEDPTLKKIKSLIESYDINSMTPLQALQFLSTLKEKSGL